MKMTAKRIETDMERLQERLRFNKYKQKFFKYLLARQNIFHQCNESKADLTAIKIEVLG